MTHSGRFRTYLLVLPIAFVAATLYARGGQNPPSRRTKASQGEVARKTTDPPTRPHGNRGQDLFLAVNHHDVAGVQALLKQGADPNARNGLEFTPLDVASASHQTDVMETLLRSGARVDAPSPYGTALTFAALGGNTEGIDLLLAKGANIDASRADGITVLMLVSRTGADKAVRELIRRKANINAKDSSGTTALMYAAREGQQEVGRVLLAAGAGVDSADNSGWTPLMSAAVTGHAEFIRLLLENGAHPNVRDAKGRTALLLTAAYGDYPDVVRALLAGGADADKRGPRLPPARAEMVRGDRGRATKGHRRSDRRPTPGRRLVATASTAERRLRHRAGALCPASGRRDSRHRPSVRAWSAVPVDQSG